MNRRLIQVTDCHLLADVRESSYGGIKPLETLKLVLKSAFDLAPEMLLLTGDLSGDGSLESYQFLKEALNTKACPEKVRIIPGNHDNVAYLQQVFSEDVLRLDGSETLGGWQIHYLNSQHEATLGFVEQERLDKLRQDLKEGADKHHIVAVHHHPIDTKSWMDKHEWLNKAEFLQILSTLNISIKVIYGHIHGESHQHQDGHDFYSCPSSCWQFAKTENFGVSDESPGYREMTIGGNGEWQTRIIRVKSSEPDLRVLN